LASFWRVFGSPGALLPFFGFTARCPRAPFWALFSGSFSGVFRAFSGPSGPLGPEPAYQALGPLVPAGFGPFSGPFWALLGPSGPHLAVFGFTARSFWVPRALFRPFRWGPPAPTESGRPVACFPPRGPQMYHFRPLWGPKGPKRAETGSGPPPAPWFLDDFDLFWPAFGRPKEVKIVEKPGLPGWLGAGFWPFGPPRPLGGPWGPQGPCFGPFRAFSSLLGPLGGPVWPFWRPSAAKIKALLGLLFLPFWPLLASFRAPKGP